ncbi:hypothetical protein [Cronobacter sakazakii]|uniref:hypothetical protein n=1 Tax=Cronobacter sakazakii TaxID=28141 RepID=UPI002012B383|nr:hypothetical protein [Cronobacter sakazakii]
MATTGTRKRGILGDFFSQGVAPLNLFDERAPRANSEALISLMDKLNQQGWGNDLFWGSASSGRDR